MTDRMTTTVLPQDLEATQPMGPVAGWYGKMPCLGDFASRRLAPEFIEAWDGWLQRSIAASRRQLGESWLDLFLTSPMWRFALSPGVCGEQAWAGLLLPSVDKVGRYFPMTFALPLEARHADLPGIFRAHAWYGALEHIGLSALSVDFSPDDLERALAVNPFPLRAAARPETAVAREHTILAAWLDGAGVAASPHAFNLPGGQSMAAVMDEAARARFAAGTAGKTFWWSVAQESGATEAHCSAGLPPEDYYAVLLGGAPPSEGTGVAAADALSADPLQAFGFGQETDEPIR